MIFNYLCGIGVPLNNSIERDGANGFKTNFDCGGTFVNDRSVGDGLIKVVSIGLKLQMFFRICDGVFVGLKYCGEGGSLHKVGNLKLPYFTDGVLSIDLKRRHVSDKYFYIDLNDDSVSYDSTNGIVLIGKCTEKCFILHVCRNAYICITERGAISGIFITLAE